MAHILLLISLYILCLRCMLYRNILLQKLLLKDFSACPLFTEITDTTVCVKKGGIGIKFLARYDTVLLSFKFAISANVVHFKTSPFLLLFMHLREVFRIIDLYLESFLLL